MAKIVYQVNCAFNHVKRVLRRWFFAKRGNFVSFPAEGSTGGVQVTDWSVLVLCNVDVTVAIGTKRDKDQEKVAVDFKAEVVDLARFCRIIVH